MRVFIDLKKFKEFNEDEFSRFVNSDTLEIECYPDGDVCATGYLSDIVFAYANMPTCKEFTKVSNGLF